MKQVYTNVIPLANSPADRLAALEALCRSKVAEVLQAYLNGEADELIRRRRYERVEEGAPVLYRNGHDPERLITTPAGAIPIRRPRVRGTTYESAVLPKHVRRLPSLDRTFLKLCSKGSRSVTSSRRCERCLGKPRRSQRRRSRV